MNFTFPRITRILTDIGQLADPVLIRNLLRDGQIIFRVLGMIRNGTATGLYTYNS